MVTGSVPWRALLCAPLASIPASVLSGLGSSDAGIASDFVYGFLFAITLALPVSYVGILLVGLPVFLVLRRINIVNLWILSTVGIAVPLLLFAGTAPLRTTLMAASSGLAVAVAAYLLRPSSALVRSAAR
jgi:hypothetical protein